MVTACEAASVEELAAIASEAAGDTIYAIDRVSEDLLIDYFEREVAMHTPIVLIAEGLEHGQVVLPAGTTESEARWRIIVDPIDGTRALIDPRSQFRGGLRASCPAAHRLALRRSARSLVGNY